MSFHAELLRLSLVLKKLIPRPEELANTPGSGTGDVLGSTTSQG